MWNDSTTVWNKNPGLEKFWSDLASGKNVVLIYKDRTHVFKNLPNRKLKKYQTTLDEFYENKEIVAVLSSNMSQDAYELYLYPKAKDKTVDYVIEHYKKYFKPITPRNKLLVPS